MPDEAKTFAQTVNESREIPEAGKEFDYPQMFNRKRVDPLIEQAGGAGKIGAEVKCVSHTRVFTVWRPWEECHRCQSAINKGEAVLPDAGDYDCPHVQDKEFKKTLDKCLSGEFALYHREHFSLMNGTRCVQLIWLETDPAYIRALKKAAKAKEDPVYPPNLKKAFDMEPPVDPTKKTGVS